MQNFKEQNVTYSIPNDFQVFQPQGLTFYRNHWQNFSIRPGEGGNKETDFVVYQPMDKRLWLVEAKDYRQNPRTKPSSLAQEFARKCRDTVGLLAALHLRNLVVKDDEKKLARVFTSAQKVSCILHVEQPLCNKLFPHVIDPKTLKDTVKKALRPLDPHAWAGNATFLNSLSLPFTIIL